MRSSARHKSRSVCCNPEKTISHRGNFLLDCKCLVLTLPSIGAALLSEDRERKINLDKGMMFHCQVHRTLNCRTRHDCECCGNASVIEHATTPSHPERKQRLKLCCDEPLVAPRGRHLPRRALQDADVLVADPGRLAAPGRGPASVGRKSPRDRYQQFLATFFK